MTSTEATSGRLHRRIGFVGAAASGVGIVLGAGIYVLIGEAAGIAGNGVWAAFLVGAVLAAGTGLSYAELTSMFPEAGAAAAYAKEAFGSRVAFVIGRMDVVVNAVGAPAVALGFGSYLAALVGLDRTAIAVVVLLLRAGIVLLGVVETIGLAALFAVIEAAGLLVMIGVGLSQLARLLRVRGLREDRDAVGESARAAAQHPARAGSSRHRDDGDLCARGGGGSLGGAVGATGNRGRAAGGGGVGGGVSAALACGGADDGGRAVAGGALRRSTRCCCCWRRAHARCTAWRGGGCCRRRWGVSGARGGRRGWRS